MGGVPTAARTRALSWGDRTAPYGSEGFWVWPLPAPPSLFSFHCSPQPPESQGGQGAGKRERPRRKVYAFRAVPPGRTLSLPWHVPRPIVHGRPLPRSAHKVSRAREDAAMLAYRGTCRGSESTSWVSVSSFCPGIRTIYTSSLSLTRSPADCPCRRYWWHCTTPIVPRQESVLDFGAAASYHFRSPDPRIRIHPTNRSRRCESSIPTFTC
jgi:hypothetical protein